MSSLKLNETPDNLDIIRNGDRFAVTVGPILRRDRWKGGTWVKYVADQSNTDSFTVERSDGVYTCGFVIYGSEDYTNARQSTYRNFTSYQNTEPHSLLLITKIQVVLHLRIGRIYQSDICM